MHASFWVVNLLCQILNKINAMMRSRRKVAKPRREIGSPELDQLSGAGIVGTYNSAPGRHSLLHGGELKPVYSPLVGQFIEVRPELVGDRDSIAPAFFGNLPLTISRGHHRGSRPACLGAKVVQIGIHGPVVGLRSNESLGIDDDEEVTEAAMGGKSWASQTQESTQSACR